MADSRRARARKRARNETLGVVAGGLGKLAKRDSRERFERRQAQVGLASNILGLTAGGAALVTAAKNPALRRPVEQNAGPVSRRLVGRVKSAKGKKALIVGGAAGALGLQVANLGGDVVANRVLSRESGLSKASGSDGRDYALGAGLGAAGGGALGAYVQRMARSAGSLSSSISPADRLERGNPEVLRQLKSMYGDNWKDAYNKEVGWKGNGGAASSASRKVKGMSFAEARRVMGTRTAAEMKARGAKVSAAHALRRMPGAGGRGAMYGALIGGAVGAASVNEHKSNKRNTQYGVVKSGGQSLVSKAEPMVVTGRGVNLEKSVKGRVEKRNFNAEADRQRRLGVYAGAGLGAGVVMGDAARRRLKLETYEFPDGKSFRHVHLPEGRNAKLILAGLGAGALASTVGGVAAYKRGVSERNRPYM